MAKYRIDLSEAQLRVINNALEEYFRIPLNQWSGLADRLALKGVDLSDEETRDVKFERFLKTRDSVNAVFRAAGEILWRYEVPPKDEEQIIAEDIWRVIRHQFYLDSGSTDTWRTDADEPMQWGPEPLPKIKKMNSKGAANV